MLPALLSRSHTPSPTAEYPPHREYRFPSDFLWGAATASHQVEGMDSGSDWWWFERQPGRIQDVAKRPAAWFERKSDHWRLFSEDIRRMRDELGLKAYRFSVDWSRVEPREGEFDDAVIRRYADLCAEMRGSGIAPLVTLFHWSSPDWIWDHAREKSTGWYDPSIVDRFARFCDRIVPALAPHVDLFCTLNEPNMFLFGGFGEGVLAPGHRSEDHELFPIALHILRAHQKAYQIIKRHKPTAKAGIAQNYAVFEPERGGHPLAGVMAAQAEQAFTWGFPDALKTGRFQMMTRGGKLLREEIPGLAGTVDFTGLNFYERFFVRIPRFWNPLGFEVLQDLTDTKEVWPKEVFTRGFVDVLTRAHRRYGLPIYVTENGCSHTDDEARERFLDEHLKALAYARFERGVDVRGYFYWTLMDNQEWYCGFTPRLGLYEVDYDTSARRLRPVGRRYAEIIRKNAVHT